MTTILETTAVVATEDAAADTAVLNVNLDVTYKLNGTEPEALRAAVEGNLTSVIGMGILTNDLPGPATVDSWDLEVAYENTPDVYPDLLDLGPDATPDPVAN